MKPLDKGIPLDEVIIYYKKLGFNLNKLQITGWEVSFPMLKPIKHSDGKRFYTAENLETLSLIIDLIVTKEHSYKYALTALKNSKSAFLQKRRAIAHLELIKKELEDWRASL